MGAIEPSVTIKELSELSTLSEVQIRRLIKEGRIKAVYMGRRVTIPADEVRRFLAGKPAEVRRVLPPPPL